MHDLERFYQAMRMHFAFEQMCLGYDEAALELHEDGRHFAGLPFFEQYKYDPDDEPEIDFSLAVGDLLKEMELVSEATKDSEYTGSFKRTPYDYYEELQEIIADMIPDFRIRLKVDPRTRRMVFAADVHSVFDICWYTLARKLSENVAPEDKGLQVSNNSKREGVLMSCPFCGEAFIRRWNRSVTCGKVECDRAVKEKISRIAAENRGLQQNRVNKLPPVLQIAGSSVHLSRKKLVCAGAFEEIASFQFYCSIDWKKKLKQNSWVSPDVNIICLHLQEVIHGIINKMFCLSLES